MNTSVYEWASVGSAGREVSFLRRQESSVVVLAVAVISEREPHG
jgi:hypothetical protein